MKSAPVFETETCSRCSGTGRYSYCQMYGDTCFKCHGKGRVYTNRGQAAKAYYESLCTMPLEKLEVGMVIWNDNFFGKPGWAAVESIKADELNSGMTTVNTAKLGQGVYAGKLFRVRQSPEQYAAKMSLAVAFERSLLVSGKPNKTLAKLMHEVAWS
jgi:hypothetical protein